MCLVNFKVMLPNKTKTKIFTGTQQKNAQTSHCIFFQHLWIVRPTEDDQTFKKNSRFQSEIVWSDQESSNGQGKYSLRNFR